MTPNSWLCWPSQKGVFDGSRVRRVYRTLANALEDFKTLFIHNGATDEELRREIEIESRRFAEWRAETLAKVEAWLVEPTKH